MNWKWDDTLCLSLITVFAGLAAWLYPVLPDPVPTHWNMQGEADGFTPKPWGAVMGPVIGLGLWALLRVLPMISPRGFRMESFLGVYRLVVLATIAFLVLVGCAALLAAAGYGIGIAAFATTLMGVLFIVIGNYLGKMRRNFFLGIRTPWTLASEKVWYRTHRLGGWLFVLAGITTVGSALAGWGAYVILPAALTAGLVPVLYSLWAYHRVEGFRSER